MGTFLQVVFSPLTLILCGLGLWANEIDPDTFDYSLLEQSALEQQILTDSLASRAEAGRINVFDSEQVPLEVLFKVADKQIPGWSFVHDPASGNYYVYLKSGQWFAGGTVRFAVVNALKGKYLEAE